MSSHAKPIATLRVAAGIPSGRLAMWWLLASEIVIFGGLLVGYIMGYLDTAPPDAARYLILLICSVSRSLSTLVLSMPRSTRSE